MIKVSIIIPTFNRENYLYQAIESALSQDYPNLEVVVSDNASTDNTAEFVKKYFVDSRFKYLRNEKNLGMVGNQRRGLFEYSSGDWGLVLDSDDYLCDNSYISKAVKLIEENKNVVLVHANFRKKYEGTERFEDSDKQLERIVPGRWMFLNYKYAVLGKVNYDKLTVLFNRRIAMELDIFKEDIISSDREAFLKITLEGDVGFISDVVAVYRVHGSNLSKSADMDVFFKNIKATLIPYEFAKQKGIFDGKQLEKWKRRMIREAAEIAMAYGLTNKLGRLSLLKPFTRRLLKEYPFAGMAMLKVFRLRVLGKILLRAIYR
ncbi:MAG TPA: glycosyltransferase family 2 protein [Thermodesulfobacteriota bacterium]|nr:glycosyltransferase family 2 protein [Thermodesulfobacteriota bacterium]